MTELEEILEDGFLIAAEKPNAIWYGGWVMERVQFARIGRTLREKHPDIFGHMLTSAPKETDSLTLQVCDTLSVFTWMKKLDDQFPFMHRCVWVALPDERWIAATQSEVGGSEVDWKRPPPKVLPKRDVDDRIYTDMIAAGISIPDPEYVTIYMPRPYDVYRIMPYEKLQRMFKYMAEHPGVELW